MPFTLIKGRFVPSAGIPDGRSIRFRANNNTLWKKLESREVELGAGKETRGTVQPRREGIDAIGKGATKALSGGPHREGVGRPALLLWPATWRSADLRVRLGWRWVRAGAFAFIGILSSVQAGGKEVGLPGPVPGESRCLTIEEKYRALGGAGGVLGFPRSDERALGDGVGRVREYQRGVIYWTQRTCAHEVHGPVRDKYASMMNERSILGYPKSDVRTRNDVTTCEFQNGLILVRGGRGVYMSGAILEFWRFPWEHSLLGYPTGDPVSLRGGEALQQDFEGGVIGWSRTTRAHEVHGAILDAWRRHGEAGGFLGLPSTDERPCPDGVGRLNMFEGGVIYWTSATGAHEVHGQICVRWAELGWERSILGYPTSDEVPGPTPGTRRSYFQRGYIEWSPFGAQEVIQLRFHAVRVLSDDDGSNPTSITPTQVDLWVQKANSIFRASRAGLEFVFNPSTGGGDWQTVTSTALNHLRVSDDEGWDRANQIARSVPGKVVCFFRWGAGYGPSANMGNGFACGPASCDAEFMVLPGIFGATTVTSNNETQVQNVWQLAHDFGHYMGLGHTFPGSNDQDTDTPAKASVYIGIRSGDCKALDGDGIADTPAEAGAGYYSKQGWKMCSEHDAYTVTGRTLLTGVPFSCVFTPARNNVMSYFACEPMGFTPGQVHRIRTNLEQSSRRRLVGR